MTKLCNLCLWPCSDDESGLNSYEWAVFPDELHYLMPDYCVQCIINIDVMLISSCVMAMVHDSEQRYKGLYLGESELWKKFTKANCISELTTTELKNLVNDNLLVRKYIFPIKTAAVLELGGFSFNSSFEKRETFAVWSN